jgi:hypothetical protein
VLQQLVAGATGDDGGDEHVRVEDEPHETTPKTSSSV